MTARPVGWVVLTNNAKDGEPKWMPDWDGEVHTDLERAETELADCRADGHESILGVVLSAEPGPQAQVEAVLNVIAQYVDAPPPYQPQRWPVLAFHEDGRAILPNDDQLRALAEQLVTAIRTASGPGRDPAVRKIKKECCGLPMIMEIEVFGIRRFVCQHRGHHPVIYVNTGSGEEMWDSQGYDARPEYEP